MSWFRTDPPPAGPPKITWHIVDDDPKHEIVLHADGRIEGDLDALRATFASDAYKFGRAGDGMSGLVQTVMWLLMREMERQRS